MTSNYKVNEIFILQLEQALIKYILACSKMFYRLIMSDCYKLAYDFAKVNNLKIEDLRERLYSVVKRHSNISLRTPDGCILARAVEFNKVNVGMFFHKVI